MKCKEKTENKKECYGEVMFEPDFSKETITYKNQKDGLTSTISWPLKRAGHGMCWYHNNLKRSKEVMDRKKDERRTMG